MSSNLLPGLKVSWGCKSRDKTKWVIYGVMIILLVRGVVLIAHAIIQ